MVSLPPVEDYSQKVIQDLSTFSKVFPLYLEHSKKTPTDFADQIRIKKHKEWIKCALASFTASESTETICRAWTETTDQILSQAWTHYQLDQFPVSLIAFGKLGSRELNLSSDIDVVFVCDDNAPIESFAPFVKEWIRCLQETTPLGFAYRVDLDLRPGGPNAPLLPRKQQFFNFFDAYLEAWNRLSFIRMRGVLGDEAVAQDILEYSHRNAFPRRLDFSVIEEIKNIRSKINYQWRKAREPFDIKKIPGGIRDIELYVQSLQVVYGGRAKNLQTSSFSQALKGLKDKGILRDEDYQFLHKTYWELRQIENLIHIQEDQHTYLVKEEFFQNRLPKKWKEPEILEKLSKSDHLVASFFEEKPVGPSAPAPSSNELSEKTRKHIDDIKQLQTHSLKRHRINKAKEQILDHFIQTTQSIAVDTELAIENFRDFIFAIRSKSSVFYLLDRNPALLENLSWLFSVSPYAGQILCRRPELMDAFALGRVDISTNEETETFLENLGDYKLLGQIFAIIDLFKNRDIQKYCERLTEQADFLFLKLKQHLEPQFKEALPLETLCLGKWSGCEMGIQSDLDFIFLSKENPSPGQMKLARRLINYLTHGAKSGKLYHVDLRLKPNESAGPLIMTKAHFQDYLKTRAEPWQKQAYLRSRFLETGRDLFSDCFQWLKISEQEKQELEEVHEKLLKKENKHSIDIKSCYGGIIHTEFVIQKLCLFHGSQPTSTRTLDILDSLPKDQDIKAQVAANYLRLRLFEQSLQICNDNSQTKVSSSHASLERMNKLLNLSDFFQSLLGLANEQSALLKELDLNN